MNGDVKILFSDLDGTLLTTDKKISDANLKAIHTLIDSGNKFVFVTGRPAYSGIEIARAYDLLKPGFFVVGYNGAVVYDVGAGKNIYTCAMSDQDLRLLLDEGRNKGFGALSYTHTHVVGEDEHEALVAYSRGLGMSYRITDDCVKYLKSSDYEPYKVIITTLEGRKLLEDFKAYIDPMVSDRLYTLITSDVLLEIGPMEVSKGTAAKALCRLMDIPMENSYAVGDESNDLSMIESVRHGIAMANAIDELKSIAEFTTENDNDHDAIAEIVKKIV